MGKRLDLLECADRLKVCKDRLARLLDGHAGVLAAIQHRGLANGGGAALKELVGSSLILGAGHLAVVGEDAYHRQIVALTDLVVVGVVGGGDLYHTGTLGHVRVLVAHDRDLLVDQGQDHVAAVEVLVALVLGVDGNGSIAQHGLGAGGGKLQVLTRFLYGVEQVIEVAGLFFIFYLGIGNRGHTGGAPVDHAVAAVDQTLVKKANENVLYRLGAALVHGEALARPVARGAHALELGNDAAAVLALPLPGALKEALATHVVLGKALCAHSLYNLCLGCDRGVVGAGEPECAEAAHALVADENVLQGVIQGVTHVKLTRDVGRGHDNSEGLFGFVGRGGEVTLFAPIFIDSFLKLAGGVGLGELMLLIHSRLTSEFFAIDNNNIP